MAKWISDSDLADKFGDAWLDELDVSGADFSIAGRAAMVQDANAWLERNGKDLRFVDCADADDEMLWLTA